MVLSDQNADWYSVIAQFEVDMNLPDELINHLRDGNVILFLGAGASYGANDVNGQGAPLGNDLGVYLNQDLLDGEFAASDPLSLIAQTALHSKGRAAVQESVQRRIGKLKPAEYHHRIAALRWRLLATTNYDVVVEQVYEQARPERLQELRPWVRNSMQIDLAIRHQDLVYLKLHGCIRHLEQDDLDLVLSPEQFNAHRDGRGNLFDHFRNVAYENPVVYVGFQLADADILLYEDQISHELSGRRPRNYVVLPKVGTHKRAMFREKNIEVLEGTFEDFLIAAEAAVPEQFRQIAGLVRAERAIESRLNRPVAELTLLPQLLDTEFEHVYPAMARTEETPQNFYRGLCRNFTPILSGWDVQRNLGRKLLETISKAQTAPRCQFYVVLGPAGSGKSTLLRRLALDLSQEGQLCLYLRENGRIDHAGLNQLWSVIDERLILFVDQAADHLSDLERLIRDSRHSKAQVTVIVTASHPEWNTVCEPLDAFLETENRFDLPPRISDSEVDALLAKLEQHRSLGVLAGRSLAERRAAFREHAERHVLVALYEATQGEPFEQIILKEYRGLQPPEAQRLYLAVALLHRFGVAVRAMLIHRAFDISHQDFRQRFFRPLEQVIFEDNDHLGPRYRTRHPVIADILFERVLPQAEDRVRELIQVMRCLNLSYESDHHVFTAMIHYRRLLEQFKGNPEAVSALYAVALTVGVARDVYWQQGMYEMRREQPDFDGADGLFDLALEQSPGDPYVLHAKAELAFMRAERAGNAAQRQQHVEHALTQLAPLLHKRTHKAVALHTQGKIELLQLRSAIAEVDQAAIAQSTDRLRGLLDRTQREYLDDPRFLKLDADFAKMLRDSTRALELLEQAYKAGPDHPHIAAQLVMAYQQVHRQEDADRVLHSALDRSPTNKKLNWLQFQRLQATAEPNVLLSYLRKSFNDGDPVAQQQFWFARFAFEFGVPAEKEKAKRHFDRLKQRYGYGSEGGRIRDKALEQGQPKAFIGEVTRKDRDYAFVRRDLDGESFFTPRTSASGAVWDELNVGRRVSFQLGYRYSGPLALALEPI